MAQARAGLVPRAATSMPETSVIHPDDMARRTLQCIHPACNRDAHTDARFAADPSEPLRRFCCGACKKTFEAGTSTKSSNHGPLCTSGPSGQGLNRAGAAPTEPRPEPAEGSAEGQDLVFSKLLERQVFSPLQGSGVKRERTDSCCAPEQSGSASGSAEGSAEKPFSAPAQVGIIHKDTDTKLITVWPEEWARKGRYPNTVAEWPLVMDAAQRQYVFQLNKQILRLVRWKPDNLVPLKELVNEHNTTPFYSIASVARESGLAEDTVLFTAYFMNYLNETARSTHKTHPRFEVNLDNAAISAALSARDPGFDRHAPGPYG